ncbi:MAG: Signal transduction histidine kinase, partial [Rhizorhabdus sp.]|nr:Signal transduction histidine kinase [Rhizorhabdus sp.]
GGVAHDFNKLLTPIMGSLDMIGRRLADDPKGIRLVEVAMGSAESAKTLIARLLSFARRQTLRPQAVDIAALVTGMTDFIRRSLGAAVVVHIDVGDRPAVAHVDSNQLELAILNLCVNARDAMQGGGALTVMVREERIDGFDLRGLSAGRYVRLSVIDTGTGMDEETRQRAIEPFFTTKEQGRGTGLGLSMVHGLAAQSGGAFMIASSPGAGTRVDLWLPPSDQPIAAAPPVPPPAVGGVHGRILLVDDDMQVRRGTAEMLEELGYQVDQAASGADALAMVEAGLAMDCVVTDYLMPGMSGASLITALRAYRPAQPIVLITGYAAPDLELAEPVHRLAKPFRQKHLAAVVAQAMSGS